jgi:hypothetical protein
MPGVETPGYFRKSLWDSAITMVNDFGGAVFPVSFYLICSRIRG